MKTKLTKKFVETIKDNNYIKESSWNFLFEQKYKIMPVTKHEAVTKQTVRVTPGTGNVSRLWSVVHLGKG